MSMFETSRRIIAAAAFFAVSIGAQAQEAQYPDYTALKDTLGNRMMSFYMQHKDMDMGHTGVLLPKDFANAKAKIAHSLPTARKKVLGNENIYPLCKPSTLIICQVDYRPKTNDFYLDIFASAAAITADGVCVSNYHVFEDLINQQADNTQEHHFIRFAADMDGNLFPLESIILADSLNDYSVFTVKLMGRKLTPIPLGKPAVEGQEVYCLSHPKGNLFYFTKGIVARNQSVTDRQTGQTKLEMQITADYAVCSSGGPIIDKYGNLVGIVGSTNSLYANADKIHNFQMCIKKAVPVITLLNGLSAH